MGKDDVTDLVCTAFGAVTSDVPIQMTIVDGDDVARKSDNWKALQAFCPQPGDGLRGSALTVWSCVYKPRLKAIQKTLNRE